MRSSHSVHKLIYHLVLVIKYRKPVINEEVSKNLKEIFLEYATNYKIKFIEWNYDLDHIHILFEANPEVKLSNFIGAYKSLSSRVTKANFIHIRKFLYKESLWSKSYCLVTAGGAPLEIIKSYIKNQRKEGGGYHY